MSGGGNKIKLLPKRKRCFGGCGFEFVNPGGGGRNRIGTDGRKAKPNRFKKGTKKILVLKTIDWAVLSFFFRHFHFFFQGAFGLSQFSSFRFSCVESCSFGVIFHETQKGKVYSLLLDL